MNWPDSHGPGVESRNAFDETVPAFLAKKSFKKINDDGMPDNNIERYEEITPPLRRFTEAAAGMGNYQFSPDRSDAYLRIQRHVFGYLNDLYVPYLQLQLSSYLKI